MRTYLLAEVDLDEIVWREEIRRDAENLPTSPAVVVQVGAALFAAFHRLSDKERRFAPRYKYVLNRHLDVEPVLAVFDRDGLYLFTVEVPGMKEMPAAGHGL